MVHSVYVLAEKISNFVFLSLSGCLWTCTGMMFLTETVNFGVGTAQLLHAVFKVAVSYVYDTCTLSSHNKRFGDHHKVANSAAQGHSPQLPENLPSVIDIKRALPKSCFEARVSTSMFYLVKDFAQVFFRRYSSLDATPSKCMPPPLGYSIRSGHET